MRRPIISRMILESGSLHQPRRRMATLILVLCTGCLSLVRANTAVSNDDTHARNIVFMLADCFGNSGEGTETA